nr:unnamed protein product [Callosobruchus chinensis]
MPVRRHTDPIQVKLIWDAIRSSNAARQIPDLARITKYIQTIGNYSPTLIESFLKNALKDKLIVTNGKKQEGAVSSYKIVDQELPELDGKDWYCFECHLAGDVIPCVRCFRVFHAACVPRVRRQFEEEKQLNCESRDRVVANEKTLSANQLGNLLESLAGEDKTTVQYDENLCFLCNLSNVDFSCGMNREELNYMLRFVLHRIRAWLPNTITHTMAQEDRPEWLTDTELTWRANQLFFEHRDMSVMEVKINTQTYATFSEFLADVYSVQHNVAIFHSDEKKTGTVTK